MQIDPSLHSTVDNYKILTNLVVPRPIAWVNRDAWLLARQRYDGGVANFIEVLDAERTLQQNQLLLAESRTAVCDDLIRLYRALGGGWESTNR